MPSEAKTLAGARLAGSQGLLSQPSNVRAVPGPSLPSRLCTPGCELRASFP